jgi:hypothetical protein
MDANRDGTVARSEMLAYADALVAMRRDLGPGFEREIAALFAAVDADGGGTLSVGEIGQAARGADNDALQKTLGVFRRLRPPDSVRGPRGEARRGGGGAPAVSARRRRRQRRRRLVAQQDDPGAQRRGW